MKAASCRNGRALIATGLAMLVASYAQASDMLTGKDNKGVSISGAWQQSPAIMTKGQDGTVVYLYGQAQPSLVCAPLQLCEIELQAGETVNDVFIGDTVRWQIEPALSGSPEGQKVHIVVKPAEPGLNTSLVITTSRRTYHIKLKSDELNYMARLAFEYPEDVTAKFNAMNAEIERSIVPGAGVPAENLDFSFAIKGQARWRPTRVYTDGVKTYIQFPGAMLNNEAPVLYVQSGKQNQIVNYRLKGSIMIVDYVFDKAVLIAGVGSRQTKITIIRRG